MTPSFCLPERTQWLRHWSALPASATKALANQLSSQHHVEDLALPQSGLGLLPVLDSALGDTYYIGEIPLAYAHVRITTAQGEHGEGAAALVDDRASVARALAILDAVVAARLPGSDAAIQLLEQGAAKISDQDQQRRALLAATRVDFSLLGAEGDDDE